VPSFGKDVQIYKTIMVPNCSIFYFIFFQIFIFVLKIIYNYSLISKVNVAKPTKVPHIRSSAF
jgi:hypothetical protein